MRLKARLVICPYRACACHRLPPVVMTTSGKIEDFIQNGHEIAIEADNISGQMIREWQREGRVLATVDHKLLLKLNRREDIPGIIAELVAHGAEIYSVNSSNKGLEEVFLDLMEN